MRIRLDPPIRGGAIWSEASPNPAEIAAGRRRGPDIARKTIEACMARGWAERWLANPIKPDWLVCKLTAAGYHVLGRAPPAKTAG